MNLPTCHQYIRRKSQSLNIRDTGLATFLITGVEKSQIASGLRSVGVQQHQPSHALWVGQRPVDGRWARSVMGDKDDLPEPQLGDDGVEVTDLIVGGVRVAGRLVGTAPPEGIK